MRDAGGSEGLSAGEIFRVRAEGDWDEQVYCGAELPELCFSWPQESSIDRPTQSQTSAGQPLSAATCTVRRRALELPLWLVVEAMGHEQRIAVRGVQLVHHDHGRGGAVQQHVNEPDCEVVVSTAPGPVSLEREGHRLRTCSAASRASIVETEPRSLVAFVKSPGSTVRLS
ncbi:hypothetical protein J1614_009235 [Plenodomus biglobosus]|nr:hypothetical protein J1614_009235 [Plenodomus biglobosus]